MRGKAPEAKTAAWNDGITPAYAGKSWRHGRKRRQTRDHPRLCGEKEWLEELKNVG